MEDLHLFHLQFPIHRVVWKWNVCCSRELQKLPHRNFSSRDHPSLPCLCIWRIYKLNQIILVLRSQTRSPCSVTPSGTYSQLTYEGVTHTCMWYWLLFFRKPMRSRLRPMHYTVLPVLSNSNINKLDHYWPSLSLLKNKIIETWVPSEMSISTNSYFSKFGN